MYTEYKFPLNTKTHIILNASIKDQSQIYELIKILQLQKHGDDVIFHLSGYGGLSQTTALLISKIKTTKATVYMSVEAPVFSAHAYIAVSGTYLRLSPHSFLMFHSGSQKNIDCSKKTKDYDPNSLDRGIKASIKCEQFKNIVDYQDNILINSVSILTADEKQRILDGEDVYITCDEFYKRMGIIR